jgi:chromosome segregation ATPase
MDSIEMHPTASGIPEESPVAQVIALRAELERVKGELTNRRYVVSELTKTKVSLLEQLEQRDEIGSHLANQVDELKADLAASQQQLMGANEASARDLSALSNQVKSLTIELEAAQEVRRNVTKELTEYGDRACKAERERDIAIRGNAEAAAHINVWMQKCQQAEQRVKELEQQNGKLKEGLCKVLEITYQVETDNLLYLLGLAEDVQKIARAALSVSLKPTSGTCQPDPSDMLKQAFKEAGIDVDFVDCTPKPEKEQG